MARDALTNDEFRAAAALLAETGDLKQVIRMHPHVDPKYFERNAPALHKAAGVVPPAPTATDETPAEKKAEAKAEAAAERKAERAEEAKEDAAAFRHLGRK